jgi:hypothetical protein
MCFMSTNVSHNNYRYKWDLCLFCVTLTLENKPENIKWIFCLNTAYILIVAFQTLWLFVALGDRQWYSFGLSVCDAFLRTRHRRASCSLCKPEKDGWSLYRPNFNPLPHWLIPMLFNDAFQLQNQAYMASNGMRSEAKLTEDDCGLFENTIPALREWRNTLKYSIRTAINWARLETKYRPSTTLRLLSLHKTGGWVSL